jgi:hypothetical protein
VLTEIEGGATMGYCATARKGMVKQAAEADQQRDDPGENRAVDKEGGHRSNPSAR